MPTTIESLPYELILVICRLSITPNIEHWPYGANVASWDSNESIVHLQLVCRAWRDPADNLFAPFVASEALRACLESVSLFNLQSAQSLLRTLREDPLRASHVRFLAIGVNEETSHESEKESSRRILEESLRMIDIINLVSSSLAHLHLHPLHFSARASLLPAIRKCRGLRSFVISPRFLSWNGGTWGVDAFSKSDVVEFSLPPLLERLELDFASTWSAPVPTLKPEATPNAITALWLNCDCEETALWQVLTQSESLESLQLYFERLLPVTETVAALMTSTGTMKRLHFISNPTEEDLAHFDSHATPIFDLLLPRYRKLEHLSVTATELSYRLFRILPPSLLKLEITSLNDAAQYFLDLQLLNDLEDHSLEISLKELVVRDQAQGYDPVLLKKFEERCRKRGVEFVFYPDTPLSSDSN
ncbi:hypothetical protein JCM16303_006606 [Sporobolomyces ruberrimus]